MKYLLNPNIGKNLKKKDRNRGLFCYWYDGLLILFSHCHRTHVQDSRGCSEDLCIPCAPRRSG